MNSDEQALPPMFPIWVAVAQNLIDRFGSKILLVGHSLGGAAVLAAADDIGLQHVAGVATIGAPSDVPHALERIDGDIDVIKKQGQGEVTIGGRPFLLGSEFIKRTEEANLLAEVEQLRAPILIMHAPTDAIVGIDHAGKLFGAAKHPKNFISLHGADHLLLKEEDARFAAGMIASWADRYLPKPDEIQMPEDGVIVRTGHGKFGTEVHTTSHRFVADEPLSYGGDNTGPTPYDLLLGALGTCTAMTVKMYADRKKWPFEGTTIHVTHERNHKDDVPHEMEEEGMEVQALHRTIELHGDLDEEQRAKLIEIADKCPVHKTLEGHLHVHTKVEQ